MSKSIQSNLSSKHSQSTAPQHYLRIWRWHFYAGLFVIPFLVILAGTGLGMIILSNTVGKQGELISVSPQNTSMAVSHQAHIATSNIAGGQVTQYIAPKDDHHAAAFLVKNHDTKVANWVAIDPYTAQIVGTQPQKSGLYHTLDSIHGDLLMGKTGDLLLETAASLTILLIITGIYLWWQKRKSVIKMLTVQDTKTKRNLWREIHAVLGSWTAIVLLFFCITGLAWAGIWGEKIMQAWNQFPAGKWGVEPVPTSSLPVDTAHDDASYQQQNTADTPHHATDISAPTHGDALNDGTKQVPWVLEKTPMPSSTPTSNAWQMTQPDIDFIDNMAKNMGFVGRYQINYPKTPTGVWSISQDSMSYDSPNPTADRTVHIDRYSGEVLADIRYHDYSAFGKFMAVGIALHMGTAGIFSILANLLFCLSVIAICISGLVMWWQRRPATNLHKNNKSALPMGLLPPASQKNIPIWWGFGGVLLLISALFPMGLFAILVIVILDWLIISRVPLLSKLLK
ncbi:PepSY-associated TM helix domain-containing protein [Moraxella catarrhalis]|uniref:PepSY-associated TM helix domain-containing protein n=1 Tax=Moraxella catarrhalis TaxID=480 RepID=UPI0002029F7F|nr:PepSY domain-containing protein [Moraxella catarrhalis]EGE23894.1 pepSY-associated membrane protein [Moraxella catarrhalis O35E]MPW79491.1 PepSY domain-containing protein [Moraxella catarrhalis]MPW96054.1 PepSY domain-containing protein [Moraxella catarrhalis]MPX21991.1 PepSY domain-containing protein [Moraxella catarrhalis]MPX76381.1 PepSY domain-containing protein [Moraxella catarrhalis]